MNPVTLPLRLFLNLNLTNSQEVGLRLHALLLPLGRHGASSGRCKRTVYVLVPFLWNSQTSTKCSGRSRSSLVKFFWSLRLKRGLPIFCHLISSLRRYQGILQLFPNRVLPRLAQSIKFVSRFKRLRLGVDYFLLPPVF